MAYDPPVRALSLWQPYASFIAAGALLPSPIKPYETRDWPPPPWLMGKRIAIHAAKKVDAGFNLPDGWKKAVKPHGAAA